MNRGLLTWPDNEAGYLQEAYDFGRLLRLRQPEPFLINVTIGITVHGAKANRITTNLRVRKPAELIEYSEVQLECLKLVLVEF